MIATALTNAFRDVGHVVAGRTATHRHFRERVTAILAFSLVLDLVAAVGILTLERDGPGTEITNFGDAIFWTSAQMLTVSSQMANPVTTGGRIVDIALEAYAISVIAALAGLFGAFFHRRGLERDADEAAG